MSPSHPHTVGHPSGATLLAPEDDDDDICPVCESECTCQNRAAPSRNDATVSSLHSISTFTASTAASSPAAAGGLGALKIRLTVPPNLKYRKHTAVDAPNSNIHQSALGVHDPAAPKRRGRPPKAVVAARKAAEAALTAQNASGNEVIQGSYGGKGFAIVQGPSGKGNQKSKGKTTTGTKAPGYARATRKAVPRGDQSDDASLDRFPTFVSAASSSTHSSSSESSDSDSELSSLDSELEEETQHLIRTEKTKLQRGSGNDTIQKRRPHSGNWETRSRKSSVGVDEEDADVDSDQSCSGEDSEDDETNSDQHHDEDVDADTEGGGLDDVEPDNEETSSRIGVTFGDGAAGWSDEDDESSFDADLFFANLDGSSDSDSSAERDDFDIFGMGSDTLSADEDDALLLMDIDSSVQVRRGQGEFEFGFGLDTLSFGWDGQLFLTSSSPPNVFSWELQHGSGDVEMHSTSEQGTESGDDDSATVDELLLAETDGETTEDELIDDDGLPNPRAMMLFRWPSTVSAINPLSTVGAAPTAPPDASESMRIALASFSAHQGSPAPTPADILAGKISIDDLEDIEMAKSPVEEARAASRRRSGGVPTMGEFVPPVVGTQNAAVIDGKGGCVPSPFPRSKVTVKRSKVASGTECDDSAAGAIEPPSESVMSSTQSSDETAMHTQRSLSQPSTTDAIDLDDVLDSSYLDSEPMSQGYDIQPFDQSILSDSAASGTHMHSLSRWDRIPMATFRRTREIASNMEGSASDTGLSVYHGMRSLLGSAMLTQPKHSDRKSGAARKRSSKGKSGHPLATNDPLSLRDGDRTPTSSAHQTPKSSKKEVRREKAMMKRKMMAKPAPYRHQQQHTHHHLPNFKSRASSSMQRMGSHGGSSPSFGM
ncbi:hypothetical protein POSPLADRAFT_1073798 [Postia placenta MAD-698-R-SB12]|uniref:Uncharacterized protein n=1 Tax=Postia placenta MAD-698-R-SB12 TaxID=670580 RepID=A0A1X6N711_9APHY|nr:hypothetical protein POSPLADRAFT_1073798 [Postia placenta MAD-698-R-SB12]OSX64193.1 hypothetical protein POSPLADRAFT_1073798 [Postia placenta MAD-698-R-SB12]